MIRMHWLIMIDCQTCDYSSIKRSTSWSKKCEQGSWKQHTGAGESVFLCGVLITIAQNFFTDSNTGHMSNHFLCRLWWLAPPGPSFRSSPTSAYGSSTMLPKNELQLFWKVSSSVDSSSSSSHSVRCIETGAQSLQLPLAACTWTLDIPFSQSNQILAWYISVAVMILLQCVSDQVQHSRFEVGSVGGTAWSTCGQHPAGEIVIQFYGHDCDLSSQNNFSFM